ncbi:hypothetical protein CNO08_07430 [Lysobacter capsici]|jgi:hypothetical protein|nr:hypothetical protein CNO08_07430 [Lysobacter capsici]
MKGISNCAWLLLGLALASMSVSAQELSARQQREADALKRFGEVMGGMARNEQCKVLDEARSKQYSDDVATITRKLERQVSGEKLLGVVINASVATAAPEQAAGCDEATREAVEAASEQARDWANEIRPVRSRDTQRTAQ